jgi:hypothetical protein
MATPGNTLPLMTLIAQIGRKQLATSHKLAIQEHAIIAGEGLKSLCYISTRKTGEDLKRSSNDANTW